MTPLSELLGQERPLARPPMPAAPVAVARAAKRIRRRWPHAEDTDPETDAERLALEMDRRRRANNWQAFYWADVTRTANAFLGGGLWRQRRFGKLLDWLSPEGARVPLEGPDASVAIDALLLPWRLHDPDRGLKNVIETRLIGVYGDPRIKDIGVWRTCADDARRVILKWLTGATLKVFFDIVSEAEHSHMWSDRRQLWIDLFEEGRITQAWLALSERGAAIARHLNRERDGASLEFARNESRTAQDRYKCLLLMNVDGRWVVEGSHSFPTWVFPRGNLSTLRPYEERYTCDQIRYFQGLEKPERIVHLGDWRNKVLTALQQ